MEKLQLKSISYHLQFVANSFFRGTKAEVFGLNKKWTPCSGYI